MADIHIHAPLVLAAGAALPPVCIGLVALRFYARTAQEAKFGLDDWLTVPGLLTVVGSCIAVLYGVAKHSTGYPTPPILPGETLLTTHSPEQSLTRSILWATEIMQVPGLTCIKMSFIFFYRRIFLNSGNRIFEIITTVALTVIGAWGIAYFFSLLFICPGHPDAFWTTLAEEKKYCIDTSTWHDSYGISDVILDFLVILLPVPQVVGLHMSGSRKIAVLGVFGLGAFSILASVLRMVTYVQSTKVEFEQGTDTDILITGVIYWAVVESGVALISSCLPTIHSFTRRKLSQGTSQPASTRGYSQRTTFRRSVLHKQGYREEKDSNFSDTLELTNVTEPSEAAAHSVARAGGLPVSNDSNSDENILVTRTFETLEEPASRVGSMV